jgi:hypothetical protein
MFVGGLRLVSVGHHPMRVPTGQAIQGDPSNVRYPALNLHVPQWGSMSYYCSAFGGEVTRGILATHETIPVSMRWYFSRSRRLTIV